MAGFSLNSIGILSAEKGDYDQALDYQERSLTIKEELGDNRGIGYSLGNIGIVYFNKCDYDMALDYQERSLKIREKLNEKNEIGFSLQCIGLVCYEKGDYTKALDCLDRALAICEEIGNKSGMGRSLRVIGCINYDKGRYEKAEEYLENSIAIQKEIGLKEYDLLLKTTTYLFLVYKQLNNECDIKVIHSLIKETEYITFNSNYLLYQLLEDTSYLEAAHNQVQEKADNLEPDVRTKFLSYLIPKAIIEEWEKVK